MLSSKQQFELETLRFFALPIETYSVWRPPGLTITEGSTDPVTAYFAWSDRGIRTHEVTNPAELAQLVDAKSWRSRNLEMYAEGILAGDIPWFSLVCDMPEELAKWVIRETCKMLGRSDWDEIWDFMAKEFDFYNNPP